MLPFLSTFVSSFKSSISSINISLASTLKLFIIFSLLTGSSNTSITFLKLAFELLKNSILASGSSFLLISGCDVKAFTELRPHFEKYGYSEADLVELDRYNALCLIKNEESNYSAFVSKLPA